MRCFVFLLSFLISALVAQTATAQISVDIMMIPLYMDAKTNEVTAGTPIIGWGGNFQGNQAFYRDGGQIKLKNTNFCIGVPPNQIVEGAAFVLQICSNTSLGQHFRFIKRSPGDTETRAIKPAANAHLCVDLKQGLAGNPVILWTCHYAATQSWTKVADVDDIHETK